MELRRKLLDTSALTLSDQRQVSVIVSTDGADRMGDIVVQNGIDLTAYRKNPVVLWGHNPDAPVARSISIDIKGGKLQARVQFPPAGDDEDSDWTYQKIKSGICNTASIGFIPKEFEPINPKQPWAGLKFTKSELLEFSFVSVPANADCTIIGRSLFRGVDVPMLPSLARRTNAPARPAKRDILAPTFRRQEAREIAARARATIASMPDDAPKTREQRLLEAQNIRRYVESLR